MNIYQSIQTNVRRQKKMLIVLLDPDKFTGEVRTKVLEEFSAFIPDFIFIGGSKTTNSVSELLTSLRHINVPKVLFPGDASQFTSEADALLFLSLISGRNADYIIGQHVTSAKRIKESGIEVIPTAYILIDGGKETAVKKVSKTMPIAADDIETGVATAVAGELLGLKLTYLEAGSGANQPVVAEMIAAVKKAISHPLIVGGGIKSTAQLQQAYDAGADLVVVGNLFETHPEKISKFISYVNRDK
ncbi:MAG: geranylgeranylglyceryl/heptaprenylglyceryl phosphate synthase [Paludibacteraceae bacterium]